MESLKLLSSLSPTILFVCVILDIFLGYTVFRSNTKSTTNRLFVVLSVLISLWMSVFYFSVQQFTVELSLLLVRLSIFVVVPMNAAFILFAFTFPYEKLALSSRSIWVLTIATTLVATATLSPYVFTSLEIVDGFPTPTAGRGILLFASYILITNIITIYAMVKRYRRESGEVRTQIGFLLFATLVFLLLMFGAVLFPTMAFQDVSLIPLAPLFTLFFVGITTYASFRHHLFNVKVIATEAFVAVLSIVFFAQIFGNTNPADTIIDILIFLSTIGFGYLLIKSVKLEIKAREEIRQLADKLSDTNWELARSNEQLRIMDQRKSEFVSIASHQLRTPVTAIKGYSSMLLEDAYGKLPDDAKSPVDRIFQSSLRLAEMINDFLNVSKIEQGTMTYSKTVFDLKKLAIELVEEFHVAAGEKRLDLAVECDENARYYVAADEGKLRQILSNLVDNGIKYTPKGSVRVVLEKDPHRGESGFVYLKVRDTGVGLSQDDLHHLFGKFTRGSEGSKINTSGSGLGLYVAKKMLEAQGGNIWVDSAGQGKGTVFCVELPESHEELPK